MSQIKLVNFVAVNVKAYYLTPLLSQIKLEERCQIMLLIYSNNIYNSHRPENMIADIYCNYDHIGLYFQHGLYTTVFSAPRKLCQYTSTSKYLILNFKNENILC